MPLIDTFIDRRHPLRKKKDEAFVQSAKNKLATKYLWFLDGYYKD